VNRLGLDKIPTQTPKYRPPTERKKPWFIPPTRACICAAQNQKVVVLSELFSIQFDLRRRLKQEECEVTVNRIERVSLPTRNGAIRVILKKDCLMRWKETWGYLHRCNTRTTIPLGRAVEREGEVKKENLRLTDKISSTYPIG